MSFQILMIYTELQTSIGCNDDDEDDANDYHDSNTNKITYSCNPQAITNKYLHSKFSSNNMQN